MVSRMDAGSSSLGLNIGWGHCAMFSGKTLNSHCKVPLSAEECNGHQ